MESVCRGNLTGGSNPPLSATHTQLSGCSENGSESLSESGSLPVSISDPDRDSDTDPDSESINLSSVDGIPEIALPIDDLELSTANVSHPGHSSTTPAAAAAATFPDAKPNPGEVIKLSETDTPRSTEWVLN